MKWSVWILTSAYMFFFFKENIYFLIRNIWLKDIKGGVFNPYF